MSEDPLIFKYEIRPFADILMPRDAEILSVGEQNGALMLWAAVDPDKPTGQRVIHVVPTGTPIRVATRTLIGNVQMRNGLVFHIFDGGYRT